MTHLEYCKSRGIPREKFETEEMEIYFGLIISTDKLIWLLNYHYEKIINKWNERKLRANYNNIIVIATDRNVLTQPISRCSDNTIIKFGEIPYKKVIFSIKEYKFDYVQYLPSFKNEVACPVATNPAISKIGKYIVEEDGFDLDQFICEK